MLTSYFAKESGRNHYCFFNAELNAIMSRKLLLEQELRKAIQNNQLSLVYQPKVELSTGKMVGVESLLRWHHPNLGFISPGEFIPIAEETGQIISIGNWVLREACKQIKYWRDMGYT